jgi:hypothetical protein
VKTKLEAKIESIRRKYDRYCRIIYDFFFSDRTFESIERQSNDDDDGRMYVRIRSTNESTAAAQTPTDTAAATDTVGQSPHEQCHAYDHRRTG